VQEIVERSWNCAEQLWGQLGINNSSDRLTPTKVPGENNAVDVAAAEYSSLAIH
jgi:hypothetical protein